MNWRKLVFPKCYVDRLTARNWLLCWRAACILPRHQRRRVIPDCPPALAHAARTAAAQQFFPKFCVHSGRICCVPPIVGQHYERNTISRS